MLDQPFSPHYGTGQSIAATAVNQTLNLRSNRPIQVRLVNVGNQVIYVRVSDVADLTPASASDFAIKPNEVPQIISKGLGQLLSVIAPAIGSTLYITEGEGY